LLLEVNIEWQFFYIFGRKKTLFMMSRMRLHAKAKKEQERRAAGIEVDDESSADVK